MIYLNKNIELIETNEHYYIYYKYEKKYVEIDVLSFDILTQVSECNQIEDTTEINERITFFKNNNILGTEEQMNDNKKIKSKKFNFDIANIELGKFKTKKLNNFLVKISNVVYKNYAQKLFKILFILSIILSFICLYYADFSTDMLSLSNDSREKLGIVNYIMVYLITMAILTFHEFSHVVSYFHHTKITPFVGFKLYFLNPIVYTDVTLIKSLDKKNKFNVLFAGIYTQIIFNFFICAILLLSKNLGLHALYEIMNYVFYINLIVIIFNSNIFYKYDGYWILSSHLNTENLYEKSISSLLNNYKFKKYNILFKLYGLSLIIFRIIFWSFILYLIYYNMKPYDIPVNYIYFIISLCCMMFFLNTFNLMRKIKKIKY